ncbi:MAG: tetratricopeptide repeat protein [Pyrinomonadaceae bacterium]
MKRCPECRRDYYDDKLFFCLDDGSALLEGPASFGGEKTAVIPHFGFVGEAATISYQSSIQTAENSNSIAVLPLANLSGDPANEYLSDGISEELLNVLSKIRGLRVAARTSAFSFKGKPTTITEIGSILNVAYVLEGSIRIAGNRIRVSVQLEDVEFGYQLWSETYDRSLDDMFAVQDDIAGSVVEELRTRLTGEAVDSREAQRIETEVAVAAMGRAADPEAQRLLLLGRYFLDRTNREDAEKAIAYFRQAVELDPGFALGWAELGRAYCVAAGKNWAPLARGYEQARESINRALEIEPDLAEGHALLGRVRSAYDLDVPGAARSYEQALLLAPGNPVVRDGASILEFKLGRLERALELSRSVVEQDPLSAAVWHNLGMISHSAGLLAEAGSAFRRALELTPSRLLTNAMLSIVLLDQGSPDTALQQSAAEPDEFWRMWAQAIIYHAAGKIADSDAILANLTENYGDGDSYQIAEICAARGEADKTFEWLERAISERDPGISHANVSPRFRNLHSDERWDELMARIGLS